MGTATVAEWSTPRATDKDGQTREVSLLDKSRIKLRHGPRKK